MARRRAPAPDGDVHAGADGLRCLAEIMGPAALSGRAAPGLPGLIGQTGQCHHRPFRK